MSMEYSNSRMQKLIDEYIHSDRNREILRLRLIDGVTYERIAESISQNPEYVPVTPRQVHRIISRDAAKLYKYLRQAPEYPQAEHDSD